jgi:hypothetical protein
MVVRVSFFGSKTVCPKYYLTKENLERDSVQIKTGISFKIIESTTTNTKGKE